MAYVPQSGMHHVNLAVCGYLFQLTDELDGCVAESRHVRA